MGRLQDIVTTRRRKMAGHVLRLLTERPAHTAIQLCSGCQKMAEESIDAKEDMAEYIARRPERDGCQLAWSPPDRQ